MPKISANYRELNPEEIDEAFKAFGEAWKNPEIPQLQYELAVQPELKRWQEGEPIAPYEAFIKCIDKAQLPNSKEVALLDVGASSGYYNRVLAICGYAYQYFGVDFSEAFVLFALKTFSGINFRAGDIQAIPYGRDAFPIVVTGGCLMHVKNYAHGISEIARVTSRYALFHRTPVFTDGRPTSYFVKEAYGVPTVEIHFNEPELLELFSKNGLSLVHTEDVFFGAGFGHRNYLLEKEELFHHPV